MPRNNKKQNCWGGNDGFSMRKKTIECIVSGWYVCQGETIKEEECIKDF